MILKLKDKLIVAFIIMIILPFSLIVISASTIVRFQVNSIYQAYDVETESIQDITNPVRILNRVTRGAYNEIKLKALKNPEELEDYQFYQELNDSLMEKYTFLAVRKNDKYIYVGDENRLSKVKANLPSYGNYDIELDGGIYIGGKSPSLVKGQDFRFSDGGQGTIFLITDLNILVPEVKRIGIQILISFVVIMLLTAILLIYWIYRSIIKPINILKLATNRIKDGDLDTSVRVESDDEIGQLCEDFEKMRIRLKDLIEDRIQYEDDMKEVVSNISHDLKTPLTAIAGYTEGLIDGVADTYQKQDKYLKTISMKAKEMSALVDELALFSMIDSEIVPYSFKKINIHDFFVDCVDDVKIELEVKDIEIEYINKTDKSSFVLADPEQIKRVVQNIISNSIKYMDKEKGKIRLEIKDVITPKGPSDESIQVDIRDNGSGIAINNQPYIFDRFYREDKSRSSNTGGSGLGLAIVKKIVEGHGGKVWVQSEEGHGTKISFTLKKAER